MTAPVNTGFTLNPKLYDFLKYLAAVVLPALVTFIAALGLLINWSGAVTVAGIIGLVDAFLGSLLGKSSKNYAEQQNFGNLVVGTDNHGNAEIKTIQGTVEDPVLKVGSKVTLNVVADHTLPPQ